MENGDSPDLHWTRVISLLAFHLSGCRLLRPRRFRPRWLTPSRSCTPTTQHHERIRLSGIDCPEKGEAYGKHAKQATSDLAFRKEVTVQTHGLDKYKRSIGEVILPDGINLNQEVVRQGWRWWYRRHAPGDAVLEEWEKAAREAKKGLRADRQPVLPWEWRKGSKRASDENCKSNQRFPGEYDCHRCWLCDCGSDQ